jgi:nucleotide-binding universal stress UspA family protein
MPASRGFPLNSPRSSKASTPAEIAVDTLISEGLPFLEILRKADDFAVDAIVLGKIGTRGPVEKLLFGSTAEKVLRGSRRPVIVLPTTSPP